MRKQPDETESRDLFLDALRADDMEGCERTARAALVRNPDDTEAHQRLGMALMRLGRMEEAVEHARERTSAAPNDAVSRLNLASVLLTAGDNVSALQNFQEALATDPEDPMLHLILGSALRNVGELTGAMNAFKEAIRVSAARESNQRWYARVLRRRWPRGFPAASINLALLYEEIGRVDEAVAEWQRVSQMECWSGCPGPNGAADILSYARGQIGRLTGREFGPPADPGQAPTR